MRQEGRDCLEKIAVLSPERGHCLIRPLVGCRGNAVHITGRAVADAGLVALGREPCFELVGFVLVACNDDRHLNIL